MPRRSTSRSLRAHQLGSKRSSRRRSHHRRLLLEPLESRHLLATFTVTNLMDAPVAAAGDAPGTLRQAIFDANAATGDDDIAFDAGLTGTITLTEGHLRISEMLTINGPGAQLLTIDASGNDPTPTENNGDGSRVFYIDGPAPTDDAVTIAGLTITGGDTSVGGGGIFSLESLTLIDSVVTGNATLADGGGVLVAIDDGTISIARSTISGNTATADGGGLHAFNATGTTTISNSTFRDNMAAYGGGLFARTSSGALTIDSSTFSGNDATARGGGIASYSGDGTATILNSTISGNEADGHGGGIVTGTTAGGTVTIAHSTITLNTANADVVGIGSGGGMTAFGPGMLEISHTIIAGNTVFNTTTFDLDTTAGLFPPTLSAMFSLIGIDDGSGLMPAPLGMPDAMGNLVGTLATSIVPMLSPLANHGGPTETHRPLVGSPVIDAGDPAIAMPPSSDQRGAPFVRIFDGDGVGGARIDIGAVERQTLAALSLVVDTLVDENDGDYSPGDLSLREAIDLANGSVGADTITFDAALDGGTIELDMGELEITEALTIDGPGAALLTIDAQQMSRVFNITAATGDFTIDGLTLTGGKTTGDNVGSDDTTFSGGAIRSLTSGNLTITNSTVTENYTAGEHAQGGGIFASGNVTLTNSTVSGNHTKGPSADGGGIYGYGDITLTNSTVSGNHTEGSGADGGGIFGSGNITLTSSTVSGNYTEGSSAEGGGIFGSGNITLTNSTVSGNHTEGSDSDGGGIFGSGNITLTSSTVSGNYTEGSSAAGGGIYGYGEITLTNSTVSGNQTDGSSSDGGGIFIYGTINVASSTISDNHTTGEGSSGGGLFVESYSGSNLIFSSTISGNSTVGDGGGIYSNTRFNDEDPDVASTIRNSTISGNTAGDLGGGVFNSNGLMIIEFSTITENTAVPDRGSGVASYGDDVTLTRVRSTIIAGNVNSDVDTIVESDDNTFESLGFNLIGTGNAVPAFNNNDQTGVTDPGLAPLADNGGPTQTHALLPDSPALDAGDPAAIAGIGTVPEFDQRGDPFLRVLDGDGVAGPRIDIGAFEFPEIILPDEFEPNNSIGTATVLGSLPEVTLRDLTIHNADDEDFFKVTANQTGKLIVRALFTHAAGDLDLEIQDMFGNVIQFSYGTADNEELIFPVVSQEMYFVRVFGFGDDINVYDLEIENFAAPVPTAIHLDPASDVIPPLGDNIISDTSPSFFIHVDVLNFVDPDGDGMRDVRVLNAAQAEMQLPGIAVEVRLVNTSDVTQPPIVVFADPISEFPTVYRVTVPGPLPDGVYFASAATRIFDHQRDELDQRDPATGRSDLGPPLWFTIKTPIDFAELGVWAAGTVLIDTNGNFTWDVFGHHHDLAFHLGFSSDYIFAGNFAGDGPDEMLGTPDDTTMASGDALASGFDKLAAYGRVGNQFRWMIDVTGDGVPDLIINDPANINGIPVAGNFDGNAENGDEVGVFTGNAWHLDTNHDFRVDTTIATTYGGFPIVGNFDGLLGDDLATYVASHNNNRFFIDLNTAAVGSPLTTDGVADTNFGIGVAALMGPAGFFGFPGVRERPVATDMNDDGVDDIGLWVPDGTALVPGDMGEWFFLVSNNDPLTAAPENTVLDRIDGGLVPFSPRPFGNDIYAQFGNSFALPVVGNFVPLPTPNDAIAPPPNDVFPVAAAPSASSSQAALTATAKSATPSTKGSSPAATTAKVVSATSAAPVEPTIAPPKIPSTAPPAAVTRQPVKPATKVQKPTAEPEPLAVQLAKPSVAQIKTAAKQTEPAPSPKIDPKQGATVDAAIPVVAEAPPPATSEPAEPEETTVANDPQPIDVVVASVEFAKESSMLDAAASPAEPLETETKASSVVKEKPLATTAASKMSGSVLTAPVSDVKKNPSRTPPREPLEVKAKIIAAAAKSVATPKSISSKALTTPRASGSPPVVPDTASESKSIRQGKRQAAVKAAAIDAAVADLLLTVRRSSHESDGKLSAHASDSARSPIEPAVDEVAIHFARNSKKR